MTAHAPATRPARSTSRAAHHPRDGWVPQQHGAWAMLASPLVVGLLAFDSRWAHLPLALTWVVGYFWFNAATLWLKSHRRPRFLPALRAYTLAVSMPAVALLVVAPEVLAWVPAFAVLSGVALWEAAQRRDRSLLSGLSTTLAAGLLTMVVQQVSGDTDWSRGALLTGVQLGYLFGVLLYVRTMIRGRHSRPLYVASVAWHLGVTAAALWVSPWLVALGLLLTGRAVLVPGRRLTPKQVGLPEIPLSAAMMLLTGLTL